jgi:hypothetical protein
MFDSLRSLSDHKLLSDTDAIVVQDRRLTLELLVHLHEIELRRLYLNLGYGSMFVYCTGHLKLSEPAAARRLRTARCLARIPELRGLFESGDVNLTTVSMVARYVHPENAGAIIARIRGKSRREVERLVAELEPRAMFPPDLVRAVVVPVSVRAVSPQVTVAGDSEKTPKAVSVDNENQPARNSETSSEMVIQKLERRALIQFTASEEFLALVERVRSVASHRLAPNASFEQVFALVMAEYVKRQDPRERHARREARQKKAAACGTAASW